jgi:hypothetical protein
VAAFLWDEADAEKQQQDFRRWSEAEPEGDTGDGSVNALTIRSDHSVGAGHPLQPHPSPLPACSRVQRQPIDPPRKHPIRAQTAAGCSALSAHPTTCYKTQISLQQTTASRCSVCAFHRDCTCSPCPAQYQATKLCDGLPDGAGCAMRAICQRRPPRRWHEQFGGYCTYHDAPVIQSSPSRLNERRFRSGYRP